MIGGLKKNSSLLAIAAAAGLYLMASPMAVQAADLGGDCCADLEERVADLEKTTVRKGNRKVSLTVSGWVNTALYFWDDGHDSDLYVVTDNGQTLSSRVTFAGAANINSDWSAGYNITIEMLQDDNFIGRALRGGELGANQLSDDNGGAVDILYSYMYLKSKSLGTISWGRQSQATDNVSIVDFSGTLFSGNNVVFRGNSFFLRRPSGAAIDPANDLTWLAAIRCGIGHDCHGDTQNVIKYETPTIAGLNIAASWGENDFWDVAARYNGDFSGFKFGAAIGYSEFDDLDGDSQLLEVGASLMHTASGLFVSGAWSQFDDTTNKTDSYYVKAGIKQRWNSLGATAIYGEYANYDNAGNGDVDRYGIGIHQWIDAASMQMYLKWDHLELNGEGDLADYDGSELDSITLGGVIFF